jgi:hypothetical protein
MNNNEKNIFDQLWQTLKLLDISEARSLLLKYTQQFIDQQKIQQQNKQENRQENNMNNNLVKVFMQKLENVSSNNSYSHHVEIMNQVNKKCVKELLYDQIEIEQLLVDNNQELNLLKGDEFIKIIEEHMNLDENSINRLVLILLLTLIHPEKYKLNLKTILNKYNLSNHELLEVINNILFLLDPQKNYFQNRNDDHDDNCQFNDIINNILRIVKKIKMNQYIPKIVDTIICHGIDNLDKDYDLVNNLEPIRGRSLRKIETNSFQKINYHNMRLIIFIIGGMTYHEKRLADMISDETKTNLIIGSTHLIETPQSYLRQIVNLNK